MSFSFPKRVVFFNEVNIICTTEIPFQSYLAGPQCRCSSGLQDCANFFYIRSIVFECVCVCAHMHMYVCMNTRCDLVCLPAGILLVMDDSEQDEAV